MKDIYLDRTDFEAKVQPKKENCLTPLLHPELVFNDTIKHRFYPESIGHTAYQSTGLICKVLLTNQARDGIWLTMEDDKDKISIPGGHMSDAEWKPELLNNPTNLIYRTLTRELLEENCYVQHGMEVYGLEQFQPDDALNYVIGQYKLKVNTTMHYPLFYAYYLEDVGSYTIYMVKEVDSPEYVPTFSNYTQGQMIWYSKREHALNRKYKGDRMSLYHMGYGDDIRCQEEGIQILDSIFNTESLFGKLDIY